MKNPKISVIVPVYNPTTYLSDSLQTLLREAVDLEVIVVDDASDHAPPGLEDFDVVCVRHEKNQGPAAAMNTGLDHSRGEYVAFLDQDDILVPGSLRWRLQWLEDRPYEATVMGAIAGIVDQRRAREASYKMVLKRRLYDLPERLTYRHFVNGGWVPLSPLALCLFRRQLLDDVGQFDPQLRRAHDREYLYRVLKKADIPYVDRSVLFYRLHDHNLSISLKDGKIVPHKRTVAELFLINEAYGIPFPSPER